MQATALPLLSPVHLAIVGGVFGTAGALSWIIRRAPACGRVVRFVLGGFLATNELVWYAYRLHVEGFHFPEGLPLQLCDLAVWLTVVATFTRKPAAFELAYFAGLGGSGMALLTPDLWAPLRSYPTLYFFLSHGTVIVTLLTMAGSGLARPRPGSFWRVFVFLNAFTALVGTFNAFFHTNYMYLCRKPANPSILDLFGPWPVYVAGAEGLAIAIFWLLWLPFRQVPGGTSRHPEQRPLPLHARDRTALRGRS